MNQLYDKHSGAAIGTITDEQFQFLQEQLEAGSPGDDDYYFNTDTLDLREHDGADTELLQPRRPRLRSPRRLKPRSKNPRPSNAPTRSAA